MKLHFRLWIVFSFIWLAGLFLLYLLIVHIYNERLLENQKQVAVSQGHVVAGRLSGLLPTFADRAQGYADYYSKMFQQRLLLVSENNELLYDSYRQYPSGTRLALAILDERGEAPVTRFVDTERFGFVQYTLMPIDQRGRTGYLLMIQDVNALNEDLRKFGGQVLTALAAATVAGFAVFYFVAAWFTKPIREIMRHLRRITPRNRRFAMVYRRKDEIGGLVAELRKMVEQMAAYEQRQRRFISTSSHELKTPLSTMQLILENLPNMREDPELHAEYIHDLQQQIDKMKQTVIGMLDVYRMAEKPLDLRPMSFADIREHVERQFAAAAENQRIRFRFEQEADDISVDRELFLLGLDNLVSNALRYSPADSVVTIRLEKRADGRMLSVCDQGIGISPDDLPYIFEAFYRSNQATRWSQEGSGLGLAIVKQMAELHGAEIEVQSGPGQGTCFHVSFRNESVT